jgi:hypothetical protein
MQVTFRCPHCDATTRASFDYGGNELVCPECAAELGRAEASAGTALERCLICPSTELYVRKDFSQKLGVTIVVIGFVLSSIAWYYRQPMLTYGILFATALIDVVLYIAVPNLLQCYRCHAQYRGLPELNGHEPFSLETHERYRQLEIRLGQAARSSSAATNHATADSHTH